MLICHQMPVKRRGSKIGLAGCGMGLKMEAGCGMKSSSRGCFEIDGGKEDNKDHLKTEKHRK